MSAQPETYGVHTTHTQEEADGLVAFVQIWKDRLRAKGLPMAAEMFGVVVTEDPAHAKLVSSDETYDFVQDSLLFKFLSYRDRDPQKLLTPDMDWIDYEIEHCCTRENHTLLDAELPRPLTASEISGLPTESDLWRECYPERWMEEQRDSRARRRTMWGHSARRGIVMDYTDIFG